MKHFVTLSLAALALVVTAGTMQAQVRSAGYIDTAFYAACLAGNSSLTTRALVVQPDGRILAGGTYNTGNSCGNGMIRLLTNGAIDTSFIAPFISGDQVNAIALQHDGQILVGGYLRAAGVFSSLVRLNSNGSLDTTYTRALIGQNRCRWW